MNVTALRQQIHQQVDELPLPFLMDVVDYVDFLRFKSKRPMTSLRVRDAIRQYTAGEISLGRAAEVAGMNYFLFEELLRQEGIPASAAKVTDEEIRAAQRELADEILA